MILLLELIFLESQATTMQNMTRALKDIYHPHRDRFVKS